MRRLSNTIVYLYISLFLFILLLVSCKPEIGPKTNSKLSFLSPYVNITSICEDKFGNIWFSTLGDGVFKFDGDNYIQYRNNDLSKSINASTVNTLFLDSNGNLWFGTQMGINKYNYDTNDFESYPINDQWNYIVNIFEGNNNEVYATTRRGLFLLNPTIKTFNKVISFENTNTPKVFIDSNNHLWLVNDYKISQYDYNYNYIKSYDSEIPIIQSIFDDDRFIYITSDSIMKRFDIQNKNFASLPSTLQDINIKQLSLLSKIDDNNFIFFSPQNQYYYNFKDDVLITDSDDNFPYKLMNKPIYAKYIFKDSNQNIWYGTNSQGFIKSTPNQRDSNPYYVLTEYLNGKNAKDIITSDNYIYSIINNRDLLIYNIKNKTVKCIELASLINKSINDNHLYDLYWNQFLQTLLLSIDNNVYSFNIDDNGDPILNKTYIGNFISGYMIATMDNNGGIWAGGMNSMLQYAPLDNDNESVINFTDFDTKPGTTQVHISKIITLKSGNIVAAYTDIGVVIINPETKEYKKIKLSDKYNQMYIQSLCEDNDGNLWIGTSDIGLFSYNLKTDDVNYYDQFKGKPAGNIKMHNNDLFMIVDATLYRYNPNNKSFISIWSNQGDIAGQSSQMCILPNGIGIIEINKKNKIANLSFNDSIINKTEFGVIIADNNSNIIETVQWNQIKDNKYKIYLDTHQNNLDLYLSFIDYNDNRFSNFQYKMEDNTNGWKDLFNTNIPLYNLSYGKHKLYLRNKIYQDNANQTEITIYIKYPWYLSWGMKIVYMLIFIFITWIIIRLIKEKNRKEIEAEIALREKTLQENMNKRNMDFFANMSHEFRTPLTIISGIAKELHKENALNDKSNLPFILQRNSDRMLRMIGQLMDFNKIDHRQLTLNVSYIDINKLIKEIVDIFCIGANEKQIRLVFDSNNEPYYAWVDIDKFEKIFYNILSNALKFTPSQGEIIIEKKINSKSEIIKEFNLMHSIDLYDYYLEITVTDSGQGIPNDKLEAIFERFTQLNPMSKIGGTGIGLYFSKLLVETHLGFIKALNRADSTEMNKTNGAVFSFAFPIGEDAYREAEQINLIEDSNVSENNVLLRIDNTKQQYEFKNLDDIPKILLIDDDYEIIHYLKSILSKDFHVISSYEAMDGYHLIEKEQPDIIISDIMMNGMDGLELCNKVKANISICHIPLILLTAKSTVDDQINGFNKGADAYIVKPFDPDYLLAVIRSLIQNRENIRQIFSESTSIKNKKYEKISDIDKELMNELYSLMEAELANPEINIIKISEQLNISRTKLYYKIKALTGKTPNDFFRLYKLNRSVDLLKENKYKIAIIADMVGFSSPSHYTSSFKKHFGVLPSKYFD